MKKSLCALFVLAAGAFSVFADAFMDAIQDLAIQTACVGVYNTHETDNPRPPEEEEKLDKYKPQMMAERFAKMSGNMTRTTTFYGVCFDYAQFAWQDIERYKSWYNEQGMYEGQFWLAWDYNNDPTIIELGSPAKSKSDATKIMNGVPIKTYNSSLRSVKTHRRNDGTRVTGHAWLWIERADGVWFWIDPTWTDNLGYVVYGYISNGEEIQCRPDRKFCIQYPDKLDSLPPPPPMGQRIPPSRSANSTDRNETIKDAGTDWLSGFDNVMRNTFIDVDYGFSSDSIAILVSVNAPFSAVMDKSPDVNQMAFALEMPMLFDTAASIIGLEYLQNIEDDHHIRGGLFTFDFTRRFTSFLAWYVGFGIGLRFDALNSDNYYAPKNIPYLAGTDYFAFKANTGLLLNISRLFTKIDVSYDNVLGFSVGAGIGFGWKVY